MTNVVRTMLFWFETDQRKFGGRLWSSLACLYAVLTHRHRSVYLLYTVTENNHIYLYSENETETS